LPTMESMTGNAFKP